MRHTVALWLLVSLLGACRCEQTLEPTQSALRFSPSQLELGQRHVGARLSFLVTLTLDGRAPCEVQLTGLAAPLRVSESTLQLSPATPADVTVLLEPDAEGEVSGVLTASGCGVTAELPLSATVVGPLPCPADESCASFVFDPNKGTCTRVPRDEGAACSSPCLVNASCTGGVCRGAALSCDDLDPCTIDACGSTGACLHLDAALSCPAPASCGVSTCDGGACPARPLSVLWTAAPTPADRDVFTQLLVADDGALFWIERRGADCTLVSVEGASGRPRFSTTFDCGNHSVEALLGDDAIIFAGGLGRTVHAFETSDGRPRWVVNLFTRLEIQPGAGLWISRGVIDGQEVVLSIVTGGQQRLIALSLLDGSIAWQRGVTRDAWSVEGDGQGHFLVDERTTGLHGFLVANRTGTVWRSMTGHQLTASGRAFTSEGIHELITGTLLAPMPPETRFVRFANERVGLRASGPTFTLGLFDTRTGAVVTELDRHNPDFFELALLADDSVLMSTWPGSALQRVHADGGVAFECATGGTFKFGAVTPGRVLGWSNGTLTAYATPGVEPGTGWWLYHGNAAAQGRPAPP